MHKPRFAYELKHYNGKFFHDVGWLHVELWRAFNAMVGFPAAVAFRRMYDLARRPSRTAP
jgi:hypothetical protein